MADTHLRLHSETSRASFFSATRVSAYILIVLGTVIAVSFYRLRTETLFACPADGYTVGRFLIYCQSEGYGDYDHGAFWFDLEPEATRAAAAADLLFVGNSRLQMGLSTTATQDWMDRNAPSYYLLGFAYSEHALFESALLRKLSPRARVYVINLDSFFEERASKPAEIVMTDPNALARYQRKQRWQYAHRAICGKVAAICGKSFAFFRDRRTGMWHPSGTPLGEKAAVSFDPKLDADMVVRETVSGRNFLGSLGVNTGCVIFTLVPSVQTSTATAAAIAAALHVDFISPAPEGLSTFDGSHLDRASAERWSAAFFEAAGPKIRECVQAQGAPATPPAK